MALTRITEGVIKPNENYVVNNINSSGVTTSTNFKTGTSNLHNVGIEIAGINVLGADTPIGTGATIYDAGGAVFTGVVTATSFSGSVDGTADLASGLTGTPDIAVRNITGVGATFTGIVSIGTLDTGGLTYPTSAGSSGQLLQTNGSDTISFKSNGSSLTDLNADNLATGTVPDGRFPATLPAASGVNLTALNANVIEILYKIFHKIY